MGPQELANRERVGGVELGRRPEINSPSSRSVDRVTHVGAGELVLLVLCSILSLRDGLLLCLESIWPIVCTIIFEEAAVLEGLKTLAEDMVAIPRQYISPKLPGRPFI